MLIVIDIDENLYTRLFDNGVDNYDDAVDMAKSIRKGIPLPKGHGRLIDADYLKDVILLHNFHGNNKNIVPYSDRRGYRLRQREVDEGIINAPTIIEADESKDKCENCEYSRNPDYTRCHNCKAESEDNE